MTRPTRAELLQHWDEGSYLDFVKSAMKDFCFTVDRHTGKERVWFGSHTVTLNRNVAFNFFDHDVRDDDGLESFPVIRSDAPQTPTFKVLADPDDPTSAYNVTAFYIERSAYDAAIASLDEISKEYDGLRMLPDVCAEDSPAIALIRDRFLVHPAVQAERKDDWPSLKLDPRTQEE